MRFGLSIRRMNILATSSFAAMLDDMDKALRANLASRQHELVKLSGFARLWTRVGIELWAWCKALSEVQVRRGL